LSIKKMEISGLRGFETKQQLELAIPNGTRGSGLTIIVGPNNGGKSTIIEAIRAFSQGSPGSFTVGKRNQKAGDKVELTLFDETGDYRSIQTVGAGGSECESLEQGKVASFGTIFVLPSRRTFNPLFSKSLYSRQEYIGSQGLPAIRSSSLDLFATRLFQIQKDRKAFDTVLSRVLEPLPNWTIDQSDGGSYFLKFDVGGAYHNSDGLGEGLVSLFFIVDALYDSKPGEMIAIDEPELSLHPSLQKKLATLISEYSSDRQIVVSTHSPYFAGVSTLVNGSKIARVVSRNFQSIICQLSTECIKKVEGFLRNVNNPHILGLDAREVFFLDDRIVLVEGQEDVIFYNQILCQINKQLNGTFFGWGVGGAGNMEAISRILNDLGFQKVAGILDDDKKDLIPHLKEQFPFYYYHSIPAKDVRSKPAFPAKEAVRGLLDESGKIRDEYQETISSLFDEINKAIA